MFKKKSANKILLIIIFILFFCLGICITYYKYLQKSKYSLKTNINNLNWLNKNKSLNQNGPTFLTPNLDSIFNSDHKWTSNISEREKIIILTTGDIIPARSVNFQTLKNNDFTWAFKNTADFLNNADLTLINLESPLISKCPVTNEGMIFCGDKRHIEGIKRSGIDIVNLANNHLGNYGLDGIYQTQNLLNQNGIEVIGNHKTVYKNIKGTTFAFLGFNSIGYSQEGLAWVDDNLIKDEIIDSKKQADLTIVAFHWGTEYVSQPNQEQIKLAHLAIDNGADLVIGNHPHWIQPIEFYKDKIIVYAHGNFIFDQEWSDKTKEGVIGKFIFYRKELIDLEFIPIKIKDYGQAYFPNQSTSNKILNDMFSYSKILKKSNNKFNKI